jgi:tetratricopeptide (TPR) repeat protein
VAAAIAATSCALLACSSPPPEPARFPIVIISIDTLRADRLPAYGYAAGRTPAIDALAREGVLFERAYTHSPQTLPAHVSMLSGRLPQQHGVRDNVGFKVDRRVRLLPNWLRERGYATGGVVSSAVLREETGFGAPFDFFDGRMPPARGGASLDEAQRGGFESVAIAREWVRQRTSPAWFLFLHLYEPHAPYLPPEQYAGLSAYDGEIAHVDAIVGEFLQDLRRNNIYGDTMILLLSDHGEGLGDHGEQEHGLFLYEESVRVPLIVKLPRGRSAGARVSQVVQHTDLVPTLLDLAGAAVPADLPGRSLRPLLEGRSQGWAERSVYSEALFGRYHFGWSEIFALTDSRYRFIQAPRSELYDLQMDPRERNNLASAQPRAAAGMGGALARVIGGADVQAPAPVTPEIRDRLASLGYIGPQSGAMTARPTDRLPDPKDKVHVLARYQTAMTHVAHGKLNDAVALLRDIVREEPGMANVWLTVGRLLLRQGRSTEAVDAFKRYIRQRPSSADGLLEASAALLSLERFAESVAHAELAAKVAKEHADRLASYEMLARIALATRDAAAARKYAATAASIDPAFPLSDYVEGRLAYNAGRFDQALASLVRAVEASRSHTLPIRGLHLYAGDAWAHLERFDEAEREFHEEIRLFPESTFAYLSLANLYQAFGRIEEAEQVLDAMLGAVPSADAQAAARKLRAARSAAGER